MARTWLTFWVVQLILRRPLRVVDSRGSPPAPLPEPVSDRVASEPSVKIDLSASGPSSGTVRTDSHSNLCLLNVRALDFLMVVGFPLAGLRKTQAVQAQGEPQQADCAETKVRAKPKKV